MRKERDREKGERNRRFGEIERETGEKKEKEESQKRENGEGKAITPSVPTTFGNLHTTQPTLQIHVSRKFSAPFIRVRFYFMQRLCIDSIYVYRRAPCATKIRNSALPQAYESVASSSPRASTRIRLLTISTNYHLRAVNKFLVSTERDFFTLDIDYYLF